MARGFSSAESVDWLNQPNQLTNPTRMIELEEDLVLPFERQIANLES